MNDEQNLISGLFDSKRFTWLVFFLMSKRAVINHLPQCGQITYIICRTET